MGAMCSRDGAAFRLGPILLTLLSMLFGVISILGVAVPWAETDYQFPAVQSPETKTAAFGLEGARFVVLKGNEPTFEFTWDDTYDTYKAVFMAACDTNNALCDQIQELFSKATSVGRATFAFMIIGLILSFAGLVTMILRRYTAIDSKHLRRCSYAFPFASVAASIIGLLVWDQEFVQTSHFGKRHAVSYAFPFASVATSIIGLLVWDQEFVQTSHFGKRHAVGVGLAGFSVTVIFLAGLMQALWRKGDDVSFGGDDIVGRKNTEHLKSAEVSWS